MIQSVRLAAGPLDDLVVEHDGLADDLIVEGHLYVRTLQHDADGRPFYEHQADCCVPALSASQAGAAHWSDI